MALNDINQDMAWELAESGNALRSEESQPSVRTRQTNAQIVEVWRGRSSNMSKTDYQALRALYEADQAGGALPWTPPGESVDRTFTFRSFRQRAFSGDSFTVTMELMHIPGLDVPAT